MIKQYKKRGYFMNKYMNIYTNKTNNYKEVL